MAYLISIVGPTGVGKTASALQLAQHFGCPIISADSVQVYRQMDIGSGKVTKAEQELVKHYLIDIVNPDEAFNAGEFSRAVKDLLPQLFQKHAQVIMVGGTGFYFDALWEGLDEMPEVPEHIREALNAAFREDGLAPLQSELEAVDPVTWALIDQNNPARIIRALEVYRATQLPISHFRKRQAQAPNPWSEIKLGLELPRDVLYPRIEARVDQMVAEGLLKETQTIAEIYGMDCKGLGALGYREMRSHLQGEYDLQTAIELIKRNTRRYAKRQFTWFRRYADLQWFAPQDQSQILDWVLAQMLK